jgi:hypothetical protein
MVSAPTSSTGCFRTEIPVGEEKQSHAIICDAAFGPEFGSDIHFSDNCNANKGSCTRFGARWQGCTTHANETAVTEFFTGTVDFKTTLSRNVEKCVKERLFPQIAGNAGMLFETAGGR